MGSVSVKNSPESWEKADLIIDRFEEALCSGHGPSLLQHSPPENHPEYTRIVSELVRIELEYGFENHAPRNLKFYEKQFPKLFEQPEFKQQIEFELARLISIYPERALGVADSTSDIEHSKAPSKIKEPSTRATVEISSGDSVSQDFLYLIDQATSVYLNLRDHTPGEQPIDLRKFLPSNPQDDATLSVFCETCDTSPRIADQIAAATMQIPKVGEKFLEFQLEAKLGRGAFGHVFLARQGDLANRYVALKISADVGGEARNLAQLQHTNIIPIYSVHRVKNLRAVCMPFLGRATLSDLILQVRDLNSPPGTWADLLSTLRLDHSRDLQKSTQKSQINKSKSQVDESADKKILKAEPIPAEPVVQPRELSHLQRAFDARSLKDMDYVTAILCIMKKVAEALMHAHERGIIHRDLKPANILFSDDGEPLLLDFNLAADMKVQLLNQVGGTLPYMAPEHLQQLLDDTLQIDPSCDIYSVGVIFYELLTGRLPFPNRSGSFRRILPEMIADRLNTSPTPPSQINPLVSPAVCAIVRRCIDPSPAARYQTSTELVEDIDNQIRNLPLRHTREPSPRELVHKWVKRHPRLTSNSFIAAVFIVISVVSAFFYARQNHKYHVSQAKIQYSNVVGQWPKVMSALLMGNSLEEERIEGQKICRETLAPYLQNARNEDWTSQSLIQLLDADLQPRLLRDLSDLMYVLALSQSRDAEKSADSRDRQQLLKNSNELLAKAMMSFDTDNIPQRLIDLNLRVGKLLRNEDPGPLTSIASIANQTTEEKNTKDLNVAMTDIRDQLLELTNPGRVALDPAKLAALAQLNDQSSSNPYTWTMLGGAFANYGEIRRAIEDYGHAIALDRNQVWSRLHRGILLMETRDYPAARRDFDVVVEKRPDLMIGWINRAQVRLASNDPQGAIDDIDRVAKSPEAPARLGFIRARCLDRLGRRDEAQQLRLATMKIQPTDEASWVARGMERAAIDPQAALADLDQALKISPTSILALQNKAYLQSDILKMPEAAIETLNVLVNNHPRFVLAITGRGVLHARAGHVELALRDASDALLFDKSSTTAYQAACIHALLFPKRSESLDTAIDLLRDAISEDPQWLSFAESDIDLAPIRNEPSFKKLLEGSRAFLKD